MESIFGILLLLVGAAIAVIAVLALNHPKGRQAANAAQTGSLTPSTQASSSKPKVTAPRTTPAASPTQSLNTPNTSTSSADKLPLIVLSNTSAVSSGTAAARFEQGGWTVTDSSTFDGSILSTAVYYDPNVTGALAAAEALQAQFPVIQRVKEKFVGLPEGPIVVVLTSDYS